MIKKATGDPNAPFSAIIKETPLFVPLVRVSPEPKRSYVRSFKSNLPPTFFSQGVSPFSVLPPDFIGMSDRMRREPFSISKPLNYESFREMNSRSSLM